MLQLLSIIRTNSAISFFCSVGSSTDSSTTIILAVVLPVLGVLIIAAFIALAVLLWTLVRAKMKKSTVQFANPDTDSMQMDLM